MTGKALAIGLALWGVDLLFMLFMVEFTDVEKAPNFWPVIIGILVVLLPINLYVATRMPGTKKPE